jgi:hypothetical protein
MKLAAPVVKSTIEHKDVSVHYIKTSGGDEVYLQAVFGTTWRPASRFGRFNSMYTVGPEPIWTRWRRETSLPTAALSSDQYEQLQHKRETFAVRLSH